MTSYTLVLSKKARKQLDQISDHIAQPIFKTILTLQTNPRPTGCKKLQGRDAYRVRTGNYRKLVTIESFIM
jgi:mRNA interferase RelE/StbE